MLPELQRGFDTVEQQRTDLQRSVSALTDAQVRAKPSPEGWSAAQIVEHLVLAEETLGRALDAQNVPTEARMFRVLPRPVRRVLVIRALDGDKTLPLPSPDVEPGGDVPLPQLWERWASARADLARALETMGQNERRFFHPIIGPLTGAQMLDLGQAHTAYHLRQLEKLRRVL